MESLLEVIMDALSNGWGGIVGFLMGWEDRIAGLKIFKKPTKISRILNIVLEFLIVFVGTILSFAALIVLLILIGWLIRLVIGE